MRFSSSRAGRTSARFNQQYFDRLRQRVVVAGERGIYVSVMLFQGWSVEKKGQVGNPWRGHPFNKANNINGIDGDRNDDGEGPEIHTLESQKKITEIQEKYVRKIIDTVNDLNNVLYEIGNEMHVGSVPWQYHMIEFIRTYERSKPRQHPIGMTGAPIANAALFDSPADWVSPTGKDGYRSDPPPADGRKVVIADVDHIWPKQHQQWVWKSFTRGLNTAFMDLYGETKIGRFIPSAHVGWPRDFVQEPTCGRSPHHTVRCPTASARYQVSRRQPRCVRIFCLRRAVFPGRRC